MEEHPRIGRRAQAARTVPCGHRVCEHGGGWCGCRRVPLRAADVERTRRSPSLDTQERCPYTSRSTRLALDVGVRRRWTAARPTEDGRRREWQGAKGPCSDPLVLHVALGAA